MPRTTARTLAGGLGLIILFLGIMKAMRSAKAAADAAGHVSGQGDAPKADLHDSKPGPAWKTVGGTLKNVEGNIYTVEDYEGNQVKLHVGQGTKHIYKKKIGDTVRAEITRGGFANSIR